MTNVYLNCLGVNNSVGSSPQEVYESIFIAGYSYSEEYNLLSGRKTRVMPFTGPLPQMPAGLADYQSRNNQLLLHAVLQIETHLKRIIENYGRKRIAIVLGTSTSGIAETEKSFLKGAGEKGNPLKYYRQEISDPSEFLRKYLELESVSYTISTACTSSAKVFIEAKRLLDANLCDAVIVGGVDSLTSMTLNGFDSLDSVSPDVTNPFSQNREGINIGEGAAVFIMSREKSEVEFLGYGESSDAYHLSSPDPEGVGAEIALRAALKAANLQPNDIGYVNLHGTGTRKNDFMESHIVHRMFGTTTPVSTTKPFIGHTLGAAGAQEAAICYLAISTANADSKLPPQLWDGIKDPELPVLNFVDGRHRLLKKFCMSNSFAFGGNNVSLIFGGAHA